MRFVTMQRQMTLFIIHVLSRSCQQLRPCQSDAPYHHAVPSASATLTCSWKNVQRTS